MVKTGKTPIHWITLAAILSLSLVVNLPGLAVTPMLGTLAKVFPGTTQIENQLLTVLPNLLIIPFVLISGKLSLTRHKIATIIAALAIFLGSAILYLFAHSMIELIIYSCTLGCGAGLLIPFSTGLLADTFTGPALMRQMGLQSGISNLTLVIATYAVGWLSTGNWHLPFIVYLVAIIPVLLAPFLKTIPRVDLVNPSAAPLNADDEQALTQAIINDEARRASEARAMAGRASDSVERPDYDHPADIPDPSRRAATPAKPKERVVGGFYIGRILGLIGVYFFITFATISISYYAPFLIEKRHWSDTVSGSVNSLYFMGIFITGFTLPWLVRAFRSWTFVAGGIIITGGLALMSFITEPWSLCTGSGLCGFGYGMCQPMIYDKASRSVDTTAKATLALAFVLSANYVSIVLTPFIVDLFRDIFHAQAVTGFAFWLCFILSGAYLVITIIKRRSFAFNVDQSLYQ